MSRKPHSYTRAAMGTAAPAGATITPIWIGMCHTGKHGVLMTVENAYIALTNDPGLKNAISFNEMSRYIILDHVIGDPSTKCGRTFEDHDYSTIQRHLQHNGLKTIGKTPVQQAVDEYARTRGFHPLRKWLEKLAWDKTERLNTWLPQATGTADNEYHQLIGRWFIIAMAARILEPGCQADYMLVLEGEQGEEKSKLCRMLAGKDYFSDNLPDISKSPKDASQHLRGKWLVEIAEMHAFNRAETSDLKQFITRTTERYRPPYGHVDVSEPRQTLFIGTTNKEVYLKDETGGRRFWPVKCKNINIDWLEANRDQLFAEAVMACREGDKWWPDREFEKQHIRPHQEARYDADAWEQPISTFLATTTLPDVTITEVAVEALGYEHGRAGNGGTPINRLSKLDQIRIANVLSSLGWTRGKRSEGRRPWIRIPLDGTGV
jgi:predicted P-loop ATPase